MKSTSLCFSISSVWKLVIKNEMSYPCAQRQRHIQALHIKRSAAAYIDRLPPQNEERLGSLRQEPRELVHEDVLDLVRLLYPYAHAHAVDRGLDEHALFLVSGHGQGVEDELGRGSRFDLGDIMSFGCLRGKVGQREGGGEGAADARQVWAEGLRLEGELAGHCGGGSCWRTIAIY